MDTSEVVSGLSAITHVETNTDGSIPETYLIDGRMNKGTALCVVSPKNLEEVRSVVHFAIENDLRIVPQGARTGLVGGTVPFKPGADRSIILSMEKYRMPIAYNKIDGRVLVSAGMHLDEVNEELKTHDVKVAIDISVDPDFGGMAATNVGGSSVVRYGNFRSMTTGVEVVFADAEVSLYSTINRPTKDNSGLDFTGAIIGSGGALGVITQVELKVFPVIEHTNTVWFKVDAKSDLSDLLIKIKNNFGEKLLACEFISAEALNALADSEEQKQSNVSLPFGQEKDVDSIFIEFEASASSIDDDEKSQQLVADFIEDAGLDDIVFVAPENTWDIRHRMSDAVRMSGAKLIGCDISTTSQDVAKMRTQVRRKINKDFPNFVVADFGHLGDGGLHMNVVIPAGQSYDEEVVLAVRELIADVVKDIGGSISAEHGRGATNRPVLQKYFDPITERLFASLKETADPFNILGHDGTQPFMDR